MPHGVARYPAIVLVGGSGENRWHPEIPGDWDPDLARAVWADQLARVGVATLRTDSRGAGGSEGKKDDSTLSELADDVMAGVRFLQSRREVDPSRIGVFGISQGTCVVTIAAAGSTDVRLVIRLSGYGVPGDEMKIEQIRLLTHALGEDRYSALEPATAWNRELYRLCETDDTVSEIRDGMKRWEAERQKEAKPLPHHNSDRALDKLLSYAATPLMRSTLRYDPRVDLRRLKVN